MKKDIHPPYYDSVKIKCSCGAVFIAGSTRENLKTEICSQCHPFYTGKQKLVDTAGNVDKFKKRLEAQEKAAKTRKGKKQKRIARAQAKAKAQSEEEKQKNTEPKK